MTLLLLGLAAGACAPTLFPQACLQYEALALTPENGFAGVVAPGEIGSIDTPAERLLVSLFVVRPLRGPLDLVHVIGDHEMERWRLRPPTGESPLVVCSVGLTPGAGSCHAVIRGSPHPAAGYYYLQSNGNTVYEAGLSFYLCE